MLVIATSIIGILAVGSAQKSSQPKQIFGVILGVIVMVILSLIDYNWILKFYWVMYIVNLMLLVAVRLFGVSVNGAKRWLDLGFTRIQPSDLTKILMILFFAQFLMKREEEFKACKGLLNKTLWEGVALILPSLVLIHAQPNLSNTICLAALFAVLMYLGGLHYRFIAAVLVIVVPISIIFLSIVVQPDQ